VNRSADQQPDALSVAASGGEEVVPWPSWPRLRRARLAMTAAASPATPVGGRRHRWWVLWTVLAGLFSVNVTFTIFAVALTRVAGTFHTSQANVTWVITAPLLCFGVAAPVLGKVGDMWGHRRLYLAGTTVAAFSAVLTAAAPTIGVLIAARALSGVAGAGAGAASMALIFRVFDEEDRVKAMGWWSLVGAGGPVIGVAAGGVLIEAFGWRSLFWVQAPLTLAAVLVAAVVLPETERTEPAPFDWWGGAFITLSSLALLFGLNRAPASGWSSPVVVGSFVLFAVALAGFVRAERRAAAPLLPLPFLRRRNFSFPIGNQFFSQFAYMGGFILTPVLLERVYGYSTSRAGIMVIARPLVFSVVAPAAGYLAARTGDRAAAVAGSGVLVASMFAFAMTGSGPGTGWVLAGLALSGLALGVSYPAVAAAVANSVDDLSLGVASSAQQLVAQVGTVAGIQVMQTVQASRTGSAGLLGSFHDAYLVGAVGAVLALGCAAGILGRRREAGAAAPGAREAALELAEA
jgi:EmrB/QacA subfamily drug resistance transporter